MKYTSSEANKLLRKLNSDLDTLFHIENQSKTFLAATGEDPESVRPEFNYEQTQEEIKELQRKIRTVKHAINMFNTNTIVPGFDMTIDEMLVYLPQMHYRVLTLDEMRNMIPKVRERTYGSGSNATIDYRYINFDREKVKKDYEKAIEEYNRAQLVLDSINNSETFEIDI